MRHYEACKGYPIYSGELKNGLKLTNIARKINEVYVLQIIVHFGWMNNFLKKVSTCEALELPFGTAHFLEHVVVNELNQLPAIKATKEILHMNAKTDKEKTSFEFVIQSKFTETAARILTHFLSLIIKEETIRNEKNIVRNEYLLNKSNMDRKVLHNLLKCMFDPKEIGEDPIGNIMSIDQMEKSLIDQVYSEMYVPSNIHIVAIGEMDISSFMESLNVTLSPQTGHAFVKSYTKPTGQTYLRITETNGFIRSHLFAIGYPILLSDHDIEQRYRMDIVIRLLQDLIIQKMDELPLKKYDHLGAGVHILANRGYFFLRGSGNVELFLEGLDDVLIELEDGLGKGKYTTFINRNVEIKDLLNSIDLYEMANHLVFEANLIDYIACYQKIDLKQVQKGLELFLNKENRYVSVMACM